MDDPKTHAELLAAWSRLRYTAPLDRVTAALGYGHNNMIYFFHEGHYVKYEPGIGVQTINQNVARRTLGSTGWKDLPPSFHDGIDATLWYRYNNKAYFFRGSHYVRWLPGHGLDTEVRQIGVDGWKGIHDHFKAGIDAALHHPSNNQVYFFRGSKYCRWDPGKGIVSPALRAIGQDGWDLPEDFANGVDSALVHPVTNRIYFFKYHNYCRWKPDHGVDFGPVPIMDYWPGVMF